MMRKFHGRAVGIDRDRLEAAVSKTLFTFNWNRVAMRLWNSLSDTSAAC